MQEYKVNSPTTAPTVDEIDLRSTGRTLWERRRMIGAIALLGTALSVAIAMVQPNVYTADATVMPIDISFERLSPEMAGGGGMAALLSRAGIGRDGTVSDKLVALLKSRSVTEAVLTKHRLLPAVVGEVKAGHEQSALGAAFTVLDKTVQAKPDPLSGLIHISANHQSAEVSAALANAYIEELALFLNDNSLTSTRRKREFLEEKVRTVSKDVERLQAQLVSFQEEKNLIALDTQTQSMVQSFMTLKSQLLTKQMEVALQAKSVSANDIQLLGLRQEVEQLKDSLKAMESGAAGGMFALKDLPKMGAQLTQLQRELASKQKVFELLSEQLELSKIEEAKEALSFQVIDRAIAPDKPSGPKRPFLMVAGAVISLLLGMFVALVAGKPRRSLAEYDAI